VTDLYFWLKTLHVLSATVLFGTGLGTAFQMWRAHLGGDVRTIANVSGSVVVADWLFTLPSAIVQPVSGAVLAEMAGFEPMTSWLVVAYFLYGLAAACWFYVVWLQMQVRDIARAAAAQGQPLPEQYHRLMRMWFALGWPAFLALVVVIWLMVTKPELW
jgi:uncharacterized membrane protein